MRFVHVKVAKSDATKMKRSWKSGDKTQVMSAILTCFDFVPKTHRSSGDCSAN